MLPLGQGLKRAVPENKNKKKYDGALHKELHASCNAVSRQVHVAWSLDEGWDFGGLLVRSTGHTTLITKSIHIVWVSDALRSGKRLSFGYNPRVGRLVGVVWVANGQMLLLTTIHEQRHWHLAFWHLAKTNN